MAEPYSLRLPAGTRDRLATRAQRVGLTERALAQRYLEEGLRRDAHPLIQFRDGPAGRRAGLIGLGLDIWEIIATVKDNDGSPSAAAAYLEIAAGLVEAAVAYYGEFQAEIDAGIETNEALYQEGRAAAEAGRQALNR
jgi:hypothetical protein